MFPRRVSSCRAPDPSRDRSWRPLQAFYVTFLFTFLHVIWRIDSIKTVRARGRGTEQSLFFVRATRQMAAPAWVQVMSRKELFWSEGLPILANYLLGLLIFPAHQFILAIMFGGWVQANIVTTSHQSEDLKLQHEHDWVKRQFETTRDAVTTNPFSEWLWGGMQYQLEHQ